MQTNKKSIMESAIKLFVEKGYHATSIQDILNRSGISKRTFYNYFHSKGELFQASFLYIHQQMQMERDRILIGEDETSKDLFIHQFEVMMNFREEHNVNELIDDVMDSNDPELNHFIKQMRMSFTNWLYIRFKQIFPDHFRNYLVDASVLFNGMVLSILRTPVMLATPVSVRQVGVYCIERIDEMLVSVSGSKTQIFDPGQFEMSLSETTQSEFSFNEIALHSNALKRMIEKTVKNRETQKTASDLIMFIQEQMLAKEPRHSLVVSALTTLTHIPELNETEELSKYEETLGKLGYYIV